MNLRLHSKTQCQMFLLIFGRHIGAHPNEYPHGFSIQSSLYIGKPFVRISHMKDCTDLNLGEDLRIFISFHFSDSKLYL